MNPKVDAFLREATAWRDEMAKLRAIVLGCPLTEEVKWGQPCYTFQGRNVVLIHGFKDYCALLFIKGALLRDPDRILIRQTENVQAARQVRFTSVRGVAERETTLLAYVHEAIEVEKSGLKVQRKQTSDFAIPEEFRSRLNEDPTLKAAFDALTPGRQRAYLLYFAAPKQSRTRVARIEKSVQPIRSGKGLND